MPQDYKDMGSSLMRGFCDYELKKNGKCLKLVNFTVRESSGFDKDMEDEMNDSEFDKESVGSDEDPGEDEYNEKEFKKLITSKDPKKKKPKKKAQTKAKPVKQ